jgi:hypothetical protein
MDKGAKAQVVVAADGAAVAIVACHLLTTWWLHMVVASKLVVEPNLCFCR